MRRYALATALALASRLAPAASPGEADAGVVVRLSADVAVRAALANSEHVGIAAREIDRAEGQIDEAGSVALPQLAVNASYTRLSGLGGLIPGFSDVGGGPLPSFDSLYQADLTVTQLVYQGGQVRAGLAAARVTKDLANVNLQHTSTETVYVARISYAVVLVRQELLDAAAESLALARKFLDDVRSRRDAGQATDFDVLQASVRVRNAEAGEVRARTALQVSRAELLRVMGVDQGAEVELTDDLESMTSSFAGDRPPGPLSSHVATALGPTRGGVRAQGARLDLQAADLSVGLQRIVESVSTAGRRPTVAIEAASLGSGMHGFFDEGFDFSWRAGVSVRVPIFDGFAARGKRAQALAELAQARLARDSLARDIELEVRSAYWRLQSAREFLASASENVTQAREAVRQADARYRNGLIAELSLDEARVALAKARTNDSQARFELYRAMLDLERASGLIELPSNLPEDARDSARGDAQSSPAPAGGE
ncbi:MAG: TolC family protein [Planctomycetota bacterium]|jgi:outer membrane protein TolC